MMAEPAGLLDVAGAPAGMLPAPAPELDLAPFRGVRYAGTAPAELDRLTCPSLDQVDDAHRVALHRAHPYNAIRLGHDRTGGRRMARTLRRWLAAGVLAADPEPALYVYEIRGSRGVVRGLVGALRLLPPEAGVVLPHEDTMPAAVEHRMRLLAAAQADVEPVYLLADGSPGPAAAATAAAAWTRPLASCTAADGTRHRIWSIVDGDTLATVTADLRGRRALILDGHHRYAACLRHQAQRHARGDGAGPWDRTLALLVDTAAFGPSVQPFHRVLPGLPLDEAARRAAPPFRLTELPAAAPPRWAMAPGVRRGPAFVLTDGSRSLLLSEPCAGELAAAIPASACEPWRRLDVVAVQHVLLRRLRAAGDGRNVRYVSGAEAATAAARESGGTAVLLDPVPLGAVFDVARARERMPEKSTRFAPKPRTGLVLRSYNA
jgi:uncharacterized protein (DUF1015 family)